MGVPPVDDGTVPPQASPLNVGLLAGRPPTRLEWAATTFREGVQYRIYCPKCGADTLGKAEVIHLLNQGARTCVRCEWCNMKRVLGHADNYPAAWRS